MKLIKDFFLAFCLLFLTSCNPNQPQKAEEFVSDAEPTIVYTGTDQEKIQQIIAEIPDVEEPSLDLVYATSLTALPLSCIDRPQKQSDYKGYLYEGSVKIKPAYEDSLSFYGCYDWHSAVNSTWTMVRLYKEYPDMILGGLIEEKLDNHLSEGSLQGELKFFEEIASGGFERPYGWAWYLYLYDEISSLDHEKAEDWSNAMKPLADYFAKKTIPYLENMDYPMRVGTHGNTAYSLDLMHKYAESAKNDSLLDAINTHSIRFFGDDEQCPAFYEPSGSDFLSPCLAEAVLMSSVLPRDEFYKWFNAFMPAPYDPAFSSLKELPEIMFEKEGADEPDDTKEGSESEEDEHDLMGAKSHLVGLAFYRASAFNRLAEVLPDNDPRKELYKKLANYHGKEGFDSLYKTDYLGTHWLGTFAVLYLETLGNQNSASK